MVAMAGKRSMSYFITIILITHRPTALVLYEHAITFSQEVDLIWTRKKTGATVLYIMNRCCTIGLALAMILLLPNWSTSTVSIPRPTCWHRLTFPSDRGDIYRVSLILADLIVKFD